MKKTVSAMEARRKFGELLEGVFYNNDEVRIERNGKVMAVLVSPGQAQILQQNRDRLWNSIEELWAKNPGISADEVEREVEKAIREVRGQRGKTKRSA